MKRKIIKLLPFLIIVVVIVFYNIIKTTKRNEAQLQSSTTATAFMVALVRNDKKFLMELVVPEQREEIIEFLSSHQRFFCPPGFDFPSSIRGIRDLNYIRPISQDVDLHQNFGHDTVVNYYALYQCRIDINNLRGLNFEVRDLVIERTGDRWYVKSWGNICEAPLAGCV
jgi:hypothetical protein